MAARSRSADTARLMAVSMLLLCRDIVRRNVPATVCRLCSADALASCPFVLCLIPTMAQGAETTCLIAL